MTTSNAISSEPTLPFTIQPARTPADFADAIGLFQKYYAWLALDLSFQNYADELSSMPGKYAPDRGGDLLLARATPPSTASSQPEDAGDALGCIALRALSPGCCEMKRLYVSPAARGLGVGHALVAVVLQRARELGYAEIKLDTLAGMHDSAIRLYSAMGFAQIEKYYETPLEGTVFMGRMLGDGEQRVAAV